MARIRKHKLSKNVHMRKRKKRGPSKEIIITIIIASVMILSVFGIMFSSYNSNQSKETYGEYEFVSTQNGWMTRINDERVYFTYSPSELADLDVNPQIFELLKTPVLAITFNPNTEHIEQVEAGRLNLAQYLTLNLEKAIIYGVTEENPDYNLTSFTCANATVRVPVLDMRTVDENKVPESETGAGPEEGTSIYLEGTCVILASRERDWQAVTERLIYGMLGVLE